jgi:hypothetical protein
MYGIYIKILYFLGTIFPLKLSFSYLSKVIGQVIWGKHMFTTITFQLNLIHLSEKKIFIAKNSIKTPPN